MGLPCSLGLQAAEGNRESPEPLWCPSPAPAWQYGSRPGRRDGKGGDVASLACRSLPVLLEACREHPLRLAHPAGSRAAPGQGAGGCPPTATHASPRWLPVGPSRAPATRSSPAAAPCSRVRRAALVPPAGGRGRCAAPRVPRSPPLWGACTRWIHEVCAMGVPRQPGQWNTDSKQTTQIG